MTIKYQVNDLSFDVSTISILNDAVSDFLRSKKVDAKIVKGVDAIVVEYPDVHDIDANEDEQIVINFCKARRFGKAKKVVREYLGKIPWSSEGYRLYAQILMEEGEIDQALEQAKIALKFNPINLYAVILIGNLLSRNKSDPKAGARYYKRAIELDPNSPLAITNYAACLMQLNEKRDEQEHLYRRAIELGPDYLNAYYGLVSILIEKGEYLEAFTLCQQGLVKGFDRPENPQPMRQLMTQMLVRLSGVIVEKISAKSLIEALKQKIECESGIEIKIEEDSTLSVPAKIELAMIHGREYDKLIYRQAKYDNSYAIIHELEKHLMRIEARKVGRECNLVTLPSSAALFRERTMSYLSDRIRNAIGRMDLDGFLKHLMSGMCGQLMNCPLDLYVEKRMFEKYSEQRPALVLGVFENITSSIASVTAGEKGEFPKNVVRVNRILNGVSFMQYCELLGLDFLKELNLADDEKKLVTQLYKRFQESCNSFTAGDEWLLVQYFIEELKCASYCTILDGENHVSSNEHVEKEHAESTRTFQERMTSGTDTALNMAITMHMVSAIRELRDKPIEEVRNIAFEIAMLGCSGISPDKESGYLIPSLGGRDMSGPQVLAYYYVSWKISIPERVDGLGLPFADEYENARLIVDRE